MQRVRLLWFVLLLTAGCGAGHNETEPTRTPGASAPQGPRPVAPPEIHILTKEATKFIGADLAWQQGLWGEGMTVAVLDSGLNDDKGDFDGGTRISTRLNLTSDDGYAVNNVTDYIGHGTHIARIIASNSTAHPGVAPMAHVIPIKIRGQHSSPTLEHILAALNWVSKNSVTFGISVVNMSLSDMGCYTHVGAVPTSSDYRKVAKAINAITSKGISVVAASGNYYQSCVAKGSVSTKGQGMAFPAIVPTTISVGAVFDAFGGALSMYAGTSVHSRRPGQILPFAQRLHDSAGGAYATDIFAPGSTITTSVTEAYANKPKVAALEHGVSDAVPFVSGAILLMQEYYLRRYPGNLPAVGEIERWLKAGAANEVDDYGDEDSVENTGLTYRRLSLTGTLKVMSKELGPPVPVQ